MIGLSSACLPRTRLQNHERQQPCLNIAQLNKFLQDHYYVSSVAADFFFRTTGHILQDFHLAEAVLCLACQTDGHQLSLFLVHSAYGSPVMCNNISQSTTFQEFHHYPEVIIHQEAIIHIYNVGVIYCTSPVMCNNIS